MRTIAKKLSTWVRDSNAQYIAVDEDERVACPRREGKPVRLDGCVECLFYRGCERNAESGSVEAIWCRRDRTETLLSTYT